MNDSTIARLLRYSAASLLFFLPLAVWFALAIGGRVPPISQERFDHITGMIALGCCALFLLVGVPFILPRAWNGGVPKSGLLKHGLRARGSLVSLEEVPGEIRGKSSSIRMLLEIEIQEQDGRYLTCPEAFDVPVETASLLHPGMELPLRIDPGNRYSFMVDWSELRDPT